VQHGLCLQAVELVEQESLVKHGIWWHLFLYSFTFMGQLIQDLKNLFVYIW
jgi:hypothetical protein